ncbi:hypothetical protein ACQQ2N_07080 [Dokdonella sp. MW10]|uniref:hypothetical protein n=1 Tax=Dokdonella sp. MW10 TaxID=2992926 RepID=UPI003F7FA9B5
MVLDWKRVIVWSALTLVASQIIGVVSGFVLANTEFDAATIGELVDRHRLFRRIAFGIAAVFCYWRLAAGADRGKAMHVVAAFFLVQLADAGIALALGAPLAASFDPWSLSRSALYAAVGYGMSRILPQRATRMIPYEAAGASDVQR